MKINHCTIAHKYRYDARFADRKYRELLSSSRAGINMTRHQLHQKDQIITPLIAQGQSPYQILINHPELDMSVRSMYTYIDKGLFTARNVCLLYTSYRWVKAYQKLGDDGLRRARSS